MKSVICIAAIEDRDAVNSALDAAGLPSGLSISLPLDSGEERTLPITHCAQHSVENDVTIAALRAIPDLTVRFRTVDDPTSAADVLKEIAGRESLDGQ